MTWRKPPTFGLQEFPGRQKALQESGQIVPRSECANLSPAAGLGALQSFMNLFIEQSEKCTDALIKGLD
jgi:hypothetical protein